MCAADSITSFTFKLSEPLVQDGDARGHLGTDRPGSAHCARRAGAAHARESRLGQPRGFRSGAGGPQWEARYSDADGKRRTIGYFDDQEAAAHAVNAAIRRAGLEGRRHTNPVVDGQLVPKKRKANGHGEKSLRKRRREEAAPATPSPRARRR